MRLTSIREAAYIRANKLLSILNSKKVDIEAEEELKKITDMFGFEFNVHVYKNLLTDIDWREGKKIKEGYNGQLSYLSNDLSRVSQKSQFSQLMSCVFSSIIIANQNSNTNKGLNEFFNVSEVFDFFLRINAEFRLNLNSQIRLLISMVYIPKEKSRKRR